MKNEQDNGVGAIAPALATVMGDPPATHQRNVQHKDGRRTADRMRFG